MIRICCIEVDIGDAAHVGGPVHQISKSFDVEFPELEKWLRESMKSGCSATWLRRSVVGIEILEEKAQ